MKVPALILAVGALVLPSVSGLTEDGRGAFHAGRAPYPAFTAAGELVVLYRDGTDRLGLAGFRGGRSDYAVSALSRRLLTDAPVLKRDGSGGLWAAWAEGAPGGCEIRLARVSGRRAVTVLTVRTGTDHPVSLDLAFDGAGRPWIGCVLYSEAGYAVRVFPPADPGGRTIEVAQAEIGGLRVAAGRSGLRAFWVADENGRSEVRTASFAESGAARGGVTAAVRSSTGPILGLQAANGPDGRPWLVWSGYDGNDYEIFVASATEAGIALGSALTANEDQDLFPSLAFLPSGDPFVAWHRPESRTGRILARRRSAGAWGRELLLAPTAEPLSRPLRAVAEGGRIGLAWEESDAFRTALVDAAGL
ncbi:MAG: hypothetical protein JW742_06625, partial [Candidatus Aminicenantes bacterium]|nr:hypothetical protein [Candidatus Aminicenantes bacterium]